MKTTFIYTLIDPRNNNVKYVGKSNRPKRRLSQHLSMSFSQKSKKGFWLQKLKNLNLKPILEIVDEVEISNWGFWEQYWICQFKAWGFDLANGSDGGEMSDEDIENKRIKSLIGRKHSEETKKKISKKIRLQSPEKWTKELREKCSKANKEAAKYKKHAGAILWKEKGLQHCQFKPFAKYDLKGNLIKEYHTVEEIIKDFGENIVVTNSCKRHVIKRPGFIFRYLKPFGNDLPNTIESINETIDLYNHRKELVRKNMSEKQKLRWIK